MVLRVADQPREKSCGPERKNVSPARMDAGRRRRVSPSTEGMDFAGRERRGQRRALTLRQGVSSYSKKKSRASLRSASCWGVGSASCWGLRLRASTRVGLAREVSWLCWVRARVRAWAGCEVRNRAGMILRVSPLMAASIMMASWAWSRVSLAGRLFAGVKVMRQESQAPTPSGFPAQARHAVRPGFLKPQWQVFHQHLYEMGQPGRKHLSLGELKSRRGAVATWRGSGWAGSMRAGKDFGWAGRVSRVGRGLAAACAWAGWLEYAATFGPGVRRCGWALGTEDETRMKAS